VDEHASGGGSIGPSRLPIYVIEHDFVVALQSNRRVILRAPTGSGKSTQILNEECIHCQGGLFYCFNTFYCCAAVTLPPALRTVRERVFTAGCEH
jgi:hypothetical protein